MYKIQSTLLSILNKNTFEFEVFEQTENSEIKKIFLEIFEKD